MPNLKSGYMVSITTENSSGIGFLYNTNPENPSQGVLAASIVLANGVCMSGLSMSDLKTVERIGLLTEVKGRRIIKDLDEFASGLDKHSLGLPNGVDHSGEMIHLIRMGLLGDELDQSLTGINVSH
jgi:hypothetical protein